jgi:hypothetical protein
MTAKYDITINKGSNFDLWLQYLSDGNTAIDLTPYNAEMQIKRYRGEPFPDIFLTETGLTYGYTGGFTTGTAGIGGINLNTNYDGTSLTGGIEINIDYNATDSLDFGKYFYDLRLTIGTTYAQKLIEGRVSVEGRVAP